MVACRREPAVRSPGPLAMMLDTSNGARAARVVVTGVDSANLSTLRSGFSNDGWTRVLRLSVDGSDSIAIAGQYTADDALVTFTPAFPLDRGRTYNLRFDPGQLPSARSDSVLQQAITLPRDGSTGATIVARVLPSVTILPENALRLYIEFSAPMSRQPGIEFVHLIDDSGNEVPHAFLPLDADFWNPDHTRYTIFFDPGRVKRGVLPNEQMGRALKSGRAYALRIDSTWKDAKGIPLAHSYRYEFRAGPAVEVPISLAEWKMGSPRRATREPLVLTFPRPLDHGLLQRAIGVRTVRGQRVSGTVAVTPGEMEWRFTPSEAWRAGDYQLVVLSILEDVAGNRVGRAFEVDEFKQVDVASASDEHLMPFIVR